MHLNLQNNNLEDKGKKVVEEILQMNTTLYYLQLIDLIEKSEKRWPSKEPN
ncbi:28816_t:CDS:2 [Dentiscutata erythropus]|uniref:28816_t:CDS:1 n=1 Tax=Dentiscutata erythropus TaxID=1348616 RepID=A0A9N8YX55_9GLOM|nr:28816_t:CDS:2 [Dentiscutata erythropus]